MRGQRSTGLSLGPRAVRVWRDRRGVAALELGLTLPILMLFLVGLIELSRILWTDNALQLAVDDTGRYVLANPAATDDQITTYASHHLASVDATQVMLAVQREISGGVNFVTITATLPYETLTQLIPLGVITLSGKSRIPLIPLG